MPIKERYFCTLSATTLMGPYGGRKNKSRVFMTLKQWGNDDLRFIKDSMDMWVYGFRHVVKDEWDIQVELLDFKREDSKLMFYKRVRKFKRGASLWPSK
jgi:hypothetical protein